MCSLLLLQYSTPQHLHNYIALTLYRPCGWNILLILLSLIITHTCTVTTHVTKVTGKKSTLLLSLNLEKTSPTPGCPVPIVPTIPTILTTSQTIFQISRILHTPTPIPLVILDFSLESGTSPINHELTLDKSALMMPGLRAQDAASLIATSTPVTDPESLIRALTVPPLPLQL